jgi:branched-chain amino acid transport system substrate-binding protein
MSYFAFNYLEAKTAVVFSNTNHNNYMQSARIFSESFAAQGGKIIAVEYYSDDSDFAFLLQKHSANPPDVIFCPDDYIPAAKLVNTAYETGLANINILGTDAWDGLLAYVHKPEAMENVYYSASFSYDDKTVEVMLFVRNYFTSFSQMPLSSAAAAYTCVHILSEAIKKAGNTNWDAIVSALRENEFNVITGRIKFDNNNNPNINVYIIQIKGGVYSTFVKLTP